MKLNKQIRILELSEQKQGCFLKALNFPVTITIDADKFVKLYFSIYSDSILKSLAEKKLENNFKVFLEAFSSEYDFKFIEESISGFQGNAFYTCKYSDDLLKPFADTLLLNGIRARIILTLVPKTLGWFLSFAIASNQEIEHIINSIFPNQRKISPKQFQKITKGSLIAPKLLKRLTIPRFSGVNEIRSLNIEVPGNYTFIDNNSIKIGQVLHGEKVLGSFAITREELNQHLLCTARSGAGKTVLLMNIITELLRLGIPFIAWDFKKDYRHIIRKYPQILVIRWEDLRFNPLEPPSSIPLQRWKQMFIDCFSHCFGFFHGSRNFLLEFLDRLYKERGSNTTLQELYEMVASWDESSRRRSEYSDVVENRLYSISSNLDKVVNCKSYPIEKLLEHPVIIELDGLGRDEQNFLVELLLFWIYAYRMGLGHRGSLKHCLICDEGKRIFDATKEYRESTKELGVAPIDIITDEIREFGESLIVADQEPSKLTHSIKANTYTKITGFLGHGGDINDIAEAMDLDGEAREAITKLERGMWLVKLAGNYTKPFLIKSQDFPLKKDVTDEEIKEKMKPVLLDLGLEKEKEAIVVEEIEKPRLILPEVSEDAWTMLLDICSHPFRSIAARYKAVAFSARKGDEAKNELLRKELVREVSIPLGNQRPSKFLVLTNLALNLLKNVGHNVGLWMHVGRMGFEHQLYIVLIGYSFRNQGYQVIIEKTLADRRVDIYIDAGKKTAIEIELGPYYLNEEIKVLQHVDELIILTKESRVEIEQKLQQISLEARHRVQIQHVTDYLRNSVAYSDGIKPFVWNKARQSIKVGNKQ